MVREGDEVNSYQPFHLFNQLTFQPVNLRLLHRHYTNSTSAALCKFKA